MSSGLAVSTRPSRVMTATPTGASSAMVRRRSTPAEPIAATPAASAEPAGAVSVRPAEAGRSGAASAVAAPATAAGPAGGGTMRASARPAANPAARWSRAAVVRRAPSTPGTPRAAGASARNSRRVAASTSATGGRPHSPDSTTATPSSCAPDGSNGSVRSTPASLRRIVASRCSTPAGAGLAATIRRGRLRPPLREPLERLRIYRVMRALRPRLGRSQTPLPVRVASDRAVRSSRHLPSPPRLRRVLTSRSVRRAVSLRHHKECHPSVRRQRRSFRSRQRE